MDLHFFKSQGVQHPINCITKKLKQLKLKKMTTNEILKSIKENGGFDNINKWTKKEIAEYIKANFNCSVYVSNQVSKNIN